MGESHQQIAEPLDLKGEVCPYTFVKSKLALEEMESACMWRVRGPTIFTSSISRFRRWLGPFRWAGGPSPL